jgi:mono/diheme cytochrome c family protein
MGNRSVVSVGAVMAAAVLIGMPAMAQLVDRTVAPNTINEGIAKSLAEQIGAGRGDWSTPGSSSYIIARDPFRSIRRGRQLFQRKFTRGQGVGPITGDGAGDLDHVLAIGAGLSDSCAGCHGRPQGSAGFGGDVATRPDSRDAPHLFGLGLKEMLADEITAMLRAIRAEALERAQERGRPMSVPLVAKGIRFGWITAHPDGTLETSRVEGVDPDLRVRPFFAHGGKFSIREFVVGALNDEMGLQAVDPELVAAAAGARVVTPSGLVLDGALDRIESPALADPTADPDSDGVANEIPTSLVDHLEFYLLNYFKPGRHERTAEVRRGRQLFREIGCATCHVPSLTVNTDRRVADVETIHDPVQGVFNSLFATATPLFTAVDDGSGHPAVKHPNRQPFVVRNIFTDFKRHDLGPAFHERDYDGAVRQEFLTAALWGVGSTGPYGHDGRSMTLKDVIVRHGGEGQASRDRFVALTRPQQADLLAFLGSLVLFPPDATASSLNPGDPTRPGFPLFGHGSIKLSVLFHDPSDPE